MHSQPIVHKVSAINSVREFRKIIKRECTRVDRYDTKLSLIIYEIGNRTERDLPVQQLIRIMGRRVRTMDDIGWFHLAQIGILLPHTPTGGAYQLSEGIAKLLSSTPITLPFTIYSYPSERWPVPQSLPVFLSLRLAIKNIFSPHDITSSDDFRAHLSLELDRSTRYGYFFSLVVFHLNKILAHGTPPTKVVTYLNSRLRETDTIGWFGQDKVAAILPYADGQNCRKIAEHVCSAAGIPNEGSYTVYTYPTNWHPDITSSPPSPRPSAVVRDEAKIEERTGPEERRGSKGNGHPCPLPVESVPVASPPLPGNDAAIPKGPDDVDEFIAKPIPAWKRALDVSASCLCLALFSPLFLFAALGIKLTSPGPILYKQTRVGYLQRPFSFYKFRTMHANADSETHRKFMKELIANNEESEGQVNTKLKEDKRIFPFGRFLRKSSIDELPQLLNVLKGDMSLVGPRPCLPYEAEEYLRWHNKRFMTMPGLTGLWQVSGKNMLSFKQMVRLDIRYEKSLSLWLDLKILLKTIPAVISIFVHSSE